MYLGSSPAKRLRKTGKNSRERLSKKAGAKSKKGGEKNHTEGPIWGLVDTLLKLLERARRAGKRVLRKGKLF